MNYCTFIKLFLMIIYSVNQFIEFSFETNFLHSGRAFIQLIIRIIRSMKTWVI